MAPGSPSAAHSEVPGDATKQKLPPIPKGSTIRRRPIPTRAPSTNDSHRIYVTAKTPFRSITTRVRKQLDKNLRSASTLGANKASNSRLADKKNASLDDRVWAISARTKAQRGGSGSGSGSGFEDAGEVLVLGTGHAIQKVVEVALFFQKQNDCVVQLKTGSVGAVDDVVEGGDDEEWGGGEGKERVRMMSSLEASIKMK